MVKQTENDYKSHLEEQIYFLLNSCRSFDDGFKSEAKRIATVLRVMLYDHGKSSISLLTQLGKKDILFYDSSVPYDPRNSQPYMGLIELVLTPEGHELCALLDGDVSKYTNDKLPFDEWWNGKVILEDADKNQFTREELIKDVSNKDGGTHIDPKLNRKYANLTRNKSVGWMYSDNAGEGVVLGAELASIRQIAHEVLKSLKDEFPENFESHNFSFPALQISTSPKNGLKINPRTFFVQELKNTSKKYVNKDFKGSKIEINIESLVCYIESSRIVKYWSEFIESLGINVRSAGMVYNEIEMLKMVKIKTLGELEDLLEESMGWGKKYLKGVYINLCADKDRDLMSTERQGIINYFLVGNFPDIFTDDILETNFGNGVPENITVPAKLYNPKYNR